MNKKIASVSFLTLCKYISIEYKKDKFVLAFLAVGRNRYR